MKCVSRIERYRTIGILQGLIAQNEIKENPNRIPLADIHIEALKTAIDCMELYEEIMVLAKEIAAYSYQKANVIENKLTYLDLYKEESKTEQTLAYADQDTLMPVT